MRTKSWGNALPSDSTVFLSLDEVVAIQERLIERFGGNPGLRDKGLLESALFRPQTGYYSDLTEMAAALFESLITNHAFVDGNKRVAFFVTDVFLRMNGWKISVSPEEGYDFIVGSLENGNMDFEHLQPWINLQLQKLN